MNDNIRMANRFRGFLPIVIDVETGGFNCKTDALLEIAAVLLDIDADGQLVRGETIRYHVKPFEGANIEEASIAVNGIDPDHPLRPAIDERDALQRLRDEFPDHVATPDELDDAAPLAARGAIVQSIDALRADQPVDIAVITEDHVRIGGMPRR